MLKTTNLTSLIRIMENNLVIEEDESRSVIIEENQRNLHMTVDTDYTKITSPFTKITATAGLDLVQEEEDIDDEKPETSGSSHQGFSSVRSLRNRRISSTDSLHRINRRTIAKPKKILSSEKDIIKFYSNRKLTNFHTTSLETIHEEKETIGLRKIKRQLKFSDGLNISKQILQTRRKRIKKLLGSGHKIKKMSMEQFMSHFESLQKITENGE